MTTEAIERLIGLHEDEARRWADLLETEADLSLAIEARTELAALEADNARMRGALSDWMKRHPVIPRSETAMDEAEWIADTELQRKTESALTGAPAGAFVTRVQLREIERSRSYEDELGGVHLCCPVCCAEKGTKHASCCWLSALIGGDHD